MPLAPLPCSPHLWDQSRNLWDLLIVIPDLETIPAFKGAVICFGTTTGTILGSTGLTNVIVFFGSTKEIQIVYRLFLVNCYLLRVPRLPFQPDSNVGGGMIRNNLNIIWISLGSNMGTILGSTSLNFVGWPWQDGQIFSSYGGWIVGSCSWIWRQSWKPYNTSHNSEQPLLMLELL